MRERITHINPDCDVHGIEEFVDAGNWPAIAGLDLPAEHKVSVIDACDQVRAKTAMAAWAIEHQVNFISVGAAGGKRHAHKVEIEDLSLTTHDPLLAQLRYRLRKEQGAARKGKMGVACVFSREAVLQPAALVQTRNGASPEDPAQDSCDLQNEALSDGSLNCHGYGSVVSVTSTFGLCAAGWVLDKIAG